LWLYRVVLMRFDALWLGRGSRWLLQWMPELLVDFCVLGRVDFSDYLR
jgi:hypothetical protein